MMNARRTTIWALAVALLSVSACGGSAHSARSVEDPVEYEPESPVDLTAEQEERFEQLETALARTEPECEHTCELSELICDLRDRICGIADRHPSDTETRTRCGDAAERCDRGRERVAAVCTCEL